MGREDFQNFKARESLFNKVRIEQRRSFSSMWEHVHSGKREKQVLTSREHVSE
jgi:hypothetical protein